MGEDMSLSIIQSTKFDFSPDYQAQVRNIFLATAVPGANSEKLYAEWMSPYLNHHSDNFFLALDASQRIVGYLNFSWNSHDFLMNHAFGSCLRSMQVFSDLYQDYPIHCHMNVEVGQQGKGIGSQLVRAFVGQLDPEIHYGWHVITSPSADNRFFYQKMGLTNQVIRHNQASSYLFMGQRLRD
jgi:hypothetical protein